jgi:hypothetical protein
VRRQAPALHPRPNIYHIIHYHVTECVLEGKRRLYILSTISLYITVCNVSYFYVILNILFFVIYIYIFFFYRVHARGQAPPQSYILIFYILSYYIMLYHIISYYAAESVREGKRRLYILGPDDGRRAAQRECESAVDYKMSGNGSLRSWCAYIYIYMHGCAYTPVHGHSCERTHACTCMCTRLQTHPCPHSRTGGTTTTGPVRGPLSLKSADIVVCMNIQ